jgi:hypothetical protein
VSSGRPWRCARARIARGVIANTSCTVALNCLTLWNPAANATPVIDIDVVSSSIRAVWARWERASASGPAPRTAISWR